MRMLEGLPYPLGATWDGRGTNFALFSANAEKIELCLFDREGRRELERISLPERTDEVWHAYFPEVAPGQVYGYRAYGPYDPFRGHRFNANKLLLDPYARQLIGPFSWTDAHFGYRTKSVRADLSFDRRDNARHMLKAVVVEPAFSWGADRRPERPWQDTVIYEAHVKGLTMQHGDVWSEWKGTYKGLTARPIVEHLQKLGITAVEFLPIHAFVDEQYVIDKGLKNYWGYNTVSFFAPEPRYASGRDSLGEFKSTISLLHEAGIEVILDVVYNHTAEGNELGPTLSFRGIDNASYYWLKPDEPRYYDNFTGCGNALNLTHPRVLQMVMDSLRYWVEQFHVDGFRFDLATTLGRGPNGFDPHAGFFAAVAQDPILSKVKLIAEPWDIGLGGYQLGAFPQGWSEWNDASRRVIRSYWRGDPNLIGEMASRITGSADVFQHNGRGPRSSINHVTVHDGFTLADVTSYATKHNDANGENNADGADDNQSSNWGEEGITTNAEILKLRAQTRRNMLASLFLCQGIPLLLAGDEVSNSQAGNNNAYCQDNEVGWVDWSGLGQPDRDHISFVGQLVELRKRYPQLRSQHWLRGNEGNQPPEILWLTPEATEMTPEDWSFPEARFLAYVIAGNGQSRIPLFIVMNAGETAVQFVFPEFQEFENWSEVFATNDGSGHPQRFHVGAKHEANSRSIIVFEGQT